MLAIVTAFLLGEYFAGAVIAPMQSGGEALLARAPKVAHREEGGRLTDVPVEAVRVNDRLVVKPGDLVPVDGDVLEGTSTVDQSALTGEPLPLHAGPGTALLSGKIG